MPYLRSLYPTTSVQDFQSGYYHLFKKCVIRYNEMIIYIIRNHEIIVFNQTSDGNYGFNLNMNKSNLIILDLDETIIDQRQYNRPLLARTSEQQWGHYHEHMSHNNQNDLIFGLGGTKSANNPIWNGTCVYLIVFRRFLMRLIEQENPSSNFIIYSHAIPNSIISNLILIEFYYNYVYRMSYLPKNSETFQFDYIISRSEETDVPQKSLHIVSKLIGDINRYQRIFVIDDLAGIVWNNDVPHELTNNTDKLFCIQPPQFVVKISGDHTKWSHANLPTEVVEKRTSDRFFYKLTKFLKNPIPVHGRWVMLTELKEN
eukprot:189947_1